MQFDVSPVRQDEFQFQNLIDTKAPAAFLTPAKSSALTLGNPVWCQLGPRPCSP